MLTKLDLSACEKEAIQTPNLIQPQGYSLVIEKGTMAVTRCSANFDSTKIGPASEIPGRNVFGLLPAPLVASITQKFDFDQQKRHIIFDAQFPALSDSSVDIFICDAAGEIILEFIPSEKRDSEGFAENYLNRIVRRVMGGQNHETLFQQAADEVRSFTGYDRVMIYRFDADFNGQVIAESHEQGMESYIGLNYPASDIPAQARELYRKNMIRIIVDAAYTPVALISPEKSLPPLDMSYSYLRSVSPIHLEYLHNMGVAATLTISIIVNGGLWGLISCHHRKPYMPSLRRISTAEVFGNLFGGIIEMRVESENARRSGQLLARLDTVMDILMSQDKNQDVMDLINDRSFLFQSILPSDGILVRAGGRSVSRNFAVEEDELTDLLEGLEANMHGSIFCTDYLANVLPDMNEHIQRYCAGLMVLKLNTQPQSWWLWRRNEKTQTITWGGDPNQKAILNQQGLISPRKSFEK